MKKALYFLVFITGISYGQVAVYSLEEISDIDGELFILDGTSNENNGKVMNGAFITEGKFGNALGFDGIDDYVQFDSTEYFDINGSEVSVSLWTNLSYLPADLPGPFGPLFDSETDNYVLYEDRGNDQLRFKCTTSDGAARPGIDAIDLVPYEWIHVVGVYDGAEARVYLNGEKKGVLPLTGTVNPGQKATLGLTGTTYFEGSIDQVEVFDYALSDAEILDLYNYNPVAIKESISDRFAIYPNPNNGKFSLDQKSLSLQNARVEIINTQGQIVFNDRLDKSTFQLPPSIKGIYFVRVFTDSDIHSQLMIVE